jgi:hypothetical protein
MKKTAHRLIIIIGIQLLIALIHAFRVGQLLHGELYHLYYGYFSDLIVPFGIYFLLCAYESWLSFLRHWHTKSLIVFSAAATAEILQYFGIYALGVTFDPVDLLMYGAGVMLAAIVDIQMFSRIFTFWTVNRNQGLQKEA